MEQHAHRRCIHRCCHCFPGSPIHEALQLFSLALTTSHLAHKHFYLYQEPQENSWHKTENWLWPHDSYLVTASFNFLYVTGLNCLIITGQTQLWYNFTEDSHKRIWNKDDLSRVRFIQYPNYYHYHPFWPDSKKKVKLMKMKEYLLWFLRVLLVLKLSVCV